MNSTAHWASMFQQATTWVLPVIFAVTFHEAAHGFVAYRFGDDTAARAGRMTLNPLSHIDPFGYAKPVPVNFGRLHHPRRDMVWVALAGPAMNVLLAIISSLLFYGVEWIPPGGAQWAAANLVHSLQLNAVLCVFNMLPFPPLDGGRVAVGILPGFLARPLARVAPYGMMILRLFFGGSYAGASSRCGSDLLGWLIGEPADAVIRRVLRGTGQRGSARPI